MASRTNHNLKLIDRQGEVIQPYSKTFSHFVSIEHLLDAEPELTAVLDAMYAGPSGGMRHMSQYIEILFTITIHMKWNKSIRV